MFLILFAGKILTMIFPFLLAPVFIILAIILGFIFFLLAIFYHAGFIGERWRNWPLEKWFRQWRLYDLFTYLEKQGQKNVEVVDKTRHIFAMSFGSLKTKIDYKVEPISGTKISGPVGTQNQKIYNEYSHYFHFSFQKPALSNIVANIWFYGRERKSLTYGYESSLPKGQKDKPVESNKSDIPQISSLMNNIENLLQTYPTLRGEVEIIKGKVQIKLYEQFQAHSIDKSHPRQDFLRGGPDRINFPFVGIEKLIALFQ
jgi:hypothetical protein